MNWAGISSITSVTFKELVRERVFYSSILLGLLLMGVSFLASQLTFVGEARIATDFSISIIDLVTAFSAILLAAPLIHREIERKTIHLAFYRPLSRGQYFMGKVFGLWQVLAVNWFLLCAVSGSTVYFLGGDLGLTFLVALAFLLLQSLVLSLLALALSLRFSVGLTILCSAGFYLMGRSVSQLRFLAERTENSIASTVLEWLSYFLPNLEFFSLDTRVTYGIELGADYILGVFVYAAVAGSVLWAMGYLLIRSKEV